MLEIVPETGGLQPGQHLLVGLYGEFLSQDIMSEFLDHFRDHDKNVVPLCYSVILGEGATPMLSQQRSS